MRSTNSAPGTLTALGMETRWYSSNGRLSSTTMSLRSRRSRCSSSGEMFGVALACSTNSPNALLGTLTPENSSNPAAAQAGIPPSSACTLEKPAHERISAARSTKPSPSSQSTTRVPGRGTRRAKLSSSRLNGIERANRRWPCEKVSSSRRSTSAISAPSASIAFRARRSTCCIRAGLRSLTSPVAASSAPPCPCRDRSARARSCRDWCRSPG